MGWIRMSEQELRKVELVAQVANGRMTRRLAAESLLLSERQISRLVARYR